MPPLHALLAPLLLGPASAASFTHQSLPSVNPDERNVRHPSNEVTGSDPLSAKRAFVDHVLEDNRERNLEYNYPTKDSVGIYCHVGLGMTRDITNALDSNPDPNGSLGSGQESITVSETRMRFCRSSSYCFLISTTLVETMTMTFGDFLGDVEFDGYYSTFFAAGCENDWGTTPKSGGFDGNSENKCNLEDNWGEDEFYGKWKVKPQLTIENKLGYTEEEIEFINTNRTLDWDLEYCCESNHCSSVSAVGVSVATMALAAGVIITALL